MQRVHNLSVHSRVETANTGWLVRAARWVEDTEEAANEQIDVLARTIADYMDRGQARGRSCQILSRIVWKSRVMFVLT